MKLSKPPSLLIFVQLLCIGLLTSISGQAQKHIDSTDFYGKILLHPDESFDVEAAFSYFEKQVEMDLRKNDTINAVKKLRYMVIGQIEMGALYESEETAATALRLLDKMPTDSLVKAHKKGIYNDLGMVYRTLKNPTNAFLFYDEALQICEGASDSLIVINNKGNQYLDIEKHELAQLQFTKAYELSKQISDSLNQARALSNLGFAQSKSQHPDALDNLLLGLGIRLRNNHLAGIYSSYSHLSNYYHNRGQAKEAEDYAEKAYNIAHQINSPSYIKNSLSNLLKIKNDSIAQEYITLNDSIKLAKLQKRNKYAGMQYNLSKEKLKTEENRLLQEKEKRKKQGFQFLGILLFTGILAIYFVQRAQNRKNTIKEIFRTEARISKRVHDEVANDIYHLMTKTQLNVLEPDALLDDLEEIYSKTRDISRETNALTLQDDFGAQLSDLLQSYQKEGTVITIQNISQINWKGVSNTKKTTIYRVLQELMTNMNKHSKASQVLISFQKTRGSLQIKYVDNGIGSVLKNRNGLENTENRIKAIKGRIIFDTAPSKGFKVTLTI
ncbi:tetratricopeptide repeat-containing sensor histidine kinase [Aequorivita viscosa]|uniref:histidine kinase n=1 Tax=Aequorivita viscosa TaxID=797419 RepID=A0A1M6NG17_9FLAO|nr:tetratricopeptide repeat protein [Aequorivita viscosa]SDX35113.1 Tetratricopeptide repeat-containing protein [Aequorivita viscosa]SHJ94708.1 Tetratricopeptide repeat-containing protein [Aequorivita viscosa]